MQALETRIVRKIQNWYFLFHYKRPFYAETIRNDFHFTFFFSVFFSLYAMDVLASLDGKDENNKNK